MHLLSTIRPTQNQLRVLAKIAAAQDHPTQAANEISSDANLVAARNLLMKLDAITFSGDKAQLTQKGQQLARDQNIIDDSGEMTDDGNKLAATEANGTPDETMPAPTETPPQDFGAAPPDLGTTPPMEGFSGLFKNMLIG